MYQLASTPWVQSIQGLPASSRIPSYYADNRGATDVVSRQNQQRPHHASQLSLQPSTTAHSELNSTNGGSSDNHAQPRTISTSTHRQGINTPWAEGSNTSESHSGETSGARLGRHHTKARFLTAAEREEEANRREAQTVGTSRVGVSNAHTDTIASIAPVNNPRNGGSAGWATDEFGLADPPTPGGVPDHPPPAYSEHPVI